MEANIHSDNSSPMVFIKGMDKIIKRDLSKHKDLLQRTKLNLDAYRVALSHQVKKKKHYKSLIGGDKYDDNALRKSMDMIVIDLRHLSDKVKLTSEELDHHTLIVDTLTTQLDDFYHNKSIRDDFKNAAKH